MRFSVLYLTHIEIDINTNLNKFLHNIAFHTTNKIKATYSVIRIIVYVVVRDTWCASSTAGREVVAEKISTE